HLGFLVALRALTGNRAKKRPVLPKGDRIVKAFGSCARVEANERARTMVTSRADDKLLIFHTHPRFTLTRHLSFSMPLLCRPFHALSLGLPAF
ncbi:hypothetical protein, partial [Acinetobacter baumannii]|uniref:hypothetical protein n=1 Tax=Acinetobacter baumannii TaxID=470 RepID=UPI001C0760FF